VNEDDKEDDDDEVFDWDYNPTVLPTIYPKMISLSKMIPSDLTWITTLKDFDNSKKDISTIVSNPISLKDALRLDKNYLRLNEKYVYEFDDIFIDKLSNKLSSPDIPRHRIVLEDEKISINDRIFRLPTRYWSQMRDFLDEHLEADRIRRSSSHITSGTWMIPKDDPTIISRIIHDYRTLNIKTVKDHISLIYQDDIIERLAKVKIRGKIDLIYIYYQILMEMIDIHKIIFKTPFGIYEWLMIS
jgi:hypothetical protein